MDFFLRFSAGIYGNQVLLGANLSNLFWWFVGAGVLFIVLHAVSVPLIHRRLAHVEMEMDARAGGGGP